MAYIYQITNDINNKIYIGKTIKPVEQRFQEHIRESQKERSENRPLYLAMNKYGIEHFSISILEFVENISQLSEREKYWIEQKGSFKNGYNATLGGDGKSYIDYDLIISTYLKTLNVKKTADLLNCDSKWVKQILIGNNITLSTVKEVKERECGKAVGQFNKNDELLKTFPSIREAARFLGNEKYYTHISECINNKRKTAYICFHL